MKKIPIQGGAAVPLVESGLDPDENGWLGGDWGPDGTMVFARLGRRGIFSVSDDGGVSRLVVSPRAPDSVRYREPSFLPDGSGIVFTSAARGYPWENRIMVIRLDDDAEPTSLVTGHSPLVTPDGRLLFGRSGSRDRKGELWQARLSADFTSLDGEPRRLRSDIRVVGSARDRWLKMAVGTDGTLIYVPGTDNDVGFLAWVDRTGSAEPILTSDSPQLPSGVIGFDAPRLSPSGDRIAFRASLPDSWPSFRLFTVELERGSILTLSVDANADWPLWTPDGERIVVNRFDDKSQDLYWIRSDNVGSAEPLIPLNPEQQHAGAFTPDGRTLILQEREIVAGPDSDIHIFDVGEDEESRELIDTDAREIQPVLSPDGRWLAYVSDESGQWEVYVTDFPDHRRRVKVSTEAAWQPVWHPGGGELFYRRFGVDAVISLPYSISEGRFRPGTPSVLFESEGRFRTCCAWARDYDVTADGERFLMVHARQGETAATRLEIIRRWEAVSR